MLRKPISVLIYYDVYDFLTATGSAIEIASRLKAFDKCYPIDPVQDIPRAYGIQPDLYERVERHVDDHGNGTIFVRILQELEGEYLLDIRANAHDTMFVVTQLSIPQTEPEE